MVPLVYLIGLVAMIFTALAYAQMAKSFPLAGLGLLLRRPRHPPHASASSPAGPSCSTTCSVPTLLYVFAAESMVGHLPRHPALGVGDRLRRRSTPSSTYVGIGSLKIVNRVFLAIELVFVVIFVVIAVVAINGDTVPDAALHAPTPLWDASTVTAPLIAAALSIAVLSFLGLRRHLDARRGGHRRTHAAAGAP